jgi:hypothetical protein
MGNIKLTRHPSRRLKGSMKKEHKLTAMELQFIQYHIDDCDIKGRCTVCRGIAKLLAVYKAAVERKGEG